MPLIKRKPDPVRTTRARGLRKSMTDVEKIIWSRLRNRQIEQAKFVRQEPVGPYYPDFVCREAKLIVELDGSQHAESQYDRQRDAWLAVEGYHVMRFWNTDVTHNLEGVLEMIRLKLLERFDQMAERASCAAPTPHPNPLPACGERG